MLTGEFSQYNSDTLVNDAADDPAFCASLAELFATLPGYEHVWSKLVVGYRLQLEQEREIRKQNKVLAVPECAVREFCNNMASMMSTRIGYELMDGDTAKMADMDRHNRLVGALEETVKTFMSEHQEFNSHSGMQSMSRHPDFMAQVAIVVMNNIE